MGKIGQGILGGLSGKVGNVVGASWKGINYIRIKPVSVANPRTEGQVNQRNKFSATLAFLQPNLSFLKVGYKFHQNKRTAFNAAMAYTLKNAIIGTAPDFEVDYAVAKVSRGSLSGASTGVANASGTDVVFTWADNSAEGSARPDDKAMLLVFNPVKRESIAVLDQDIRRDAVTGTVTVPDSYEGDTVHYYMAFQAADGSAVSDSAYLGFGTIV